MYGAAMIHGNDTTAQMPPQYEEQIIPPRLN